MTLLVLLAAPGPAADLVVAPTAAVESDFGRHFSARLARGLARRRLWANVLAPDELAQLNNVPAAPLTGPLDATSAAAWQAALGTPFVVYSGLSFDRRSAVAQIVDLRGPWTIGQATLTAAMSAELLAAADDLAGRLMPAWPVEAPATVEDQQVTLSLGHVHGFRRSEAVWLVRDTVRDELGQYAHPVGVARLTQVSPRSAQAVLELGGTDLDEAAKYLAVEPLTLDTSASPWLPLELGLVRRHGEWQPELFGLWQRLAHAASGPERMALPGQLLRVAQPEVEPARLLSADLPQLSPAGPLRVGQAWAVMVNPIAGAVELSLVAPDGRSQLLLWRAADTPQPVTIHGLAGPLTGRWTIRLTQHLPDGSIATGDVGFEVLP